MYKKLLTGLLFLCTSTCALASGKFNSTFQGFQNLEAKQQIIAINNLQSVADYNNIRFSRQWPSEYFYNDGVYSFIYFTKNDVDSLDMIRFDIDFEKHDECALLDKTHDFCIPKINPISVSYIYNERLIVNYTPDFINKPNEKAVFEVLMKDDKYLGNKLISNNIEPQNKNITYDCKTQTGGKAKICKAYDQDTNALLYTEHLLLKDQNNKAIPENIFKYIKYDAIGNKIEEYIYSSGKHIFYDENGNISQLCQLNDNKFKYFNKNLPDLYINMDIERDHSGRAISETYRDRNQKAIRKYVAEYEHGNIKNIHVFDIFSKTDWYVEPIEQQGNKTSDLNIRL